MPTFAYRAATAAGRIESGVEAAGSTAALERELGVRGLIPLEVRPAGDGRRTARLRSGSRRRGTVEGIRYLATLLEAGFPLDRSLRMTAGTVTHPAVAAAFRRLREEVRTGERLSDAMAREGGVFPPLSVGMVRSGERGGLLAEATARLADQLEREEELRSRLLSALLYPAALAVVGGAAVVLLAGWVLPRFAGILADTGVALPGTTRTLLAVTAFLADAWPGLLAAALAGGLAVTAWARTEAGREAIHRFLLRAPVVGGLRRGLVASRFGRTLGSLLSSGAPILVALDVAADALPDRAAKREVAAARAEVRSGAPLAAALRRGAAFPTLFVQMVELGETGGRLPEMLERAAATEDARLERRLDRSVRMVEPAMIVFFGVVAGFVALSLLQAVYGLRLDGFP